MNKKAILLSVKPKYVAEILNGRKTIEIRKSAPKCAGAYDLPIDVYIYCTREGIRKKPLFVNSHVANGKVVAKFTLRKVDKFHVLPSERILPFNPNVEELLLPLCLTKEDVMNYGNGEDFYAYFWYIEDLVIFDEPFYINEHLFHLPVKKKDIEPIFVSSIMKAPQSWCYCQYIECDDDEEED